MNRARSYAKNPYTKVYCLSFEYFTFFQIQAPGNNENNFILFYFIVQFNISSSVDFLTGTNISIIVYVNIDKIYDKSTFMPTINI